jgi:hypothetical protein
VKPGEVLQAWTPRVRQVPSVTTANTCRLCLGPTSSGYHTCFICEFKWSAHPEYHGACDLIVPATVAVQPSDWYSVVRHYKSGAVNFRTLAPALAVVLREWLGHHSGRIATALGGTPDLVAVVPSRNTPPPTPLSRVVSWAVTNTPVLADLDVGPDAVTFVGPPPAKHKHLYPDSLEVAADLDGRRILLVEDTWVSGSTALSAAIALRRAGAAGVALISAARMVYADQMTPAYEEAAVAPVDFTHWPR